MASKPTYEELMARVQTLEDQIAAGPAGSQSDNALQDAFKTWRDTFNAMSEALAVLDTDCRILRCNRAMVTLDSWERR